MTSFEKELLKRLHDLKMDKTETITQTVLTHEDYMRQMGYFQCLRDVTAIVQDIREEIIKT